MIERLIIDDRKKPPLRPGHLFIVRQRIEASRWRDLFGNQGFPQDCFESCGKPECFINGCQRLAPGNLDRGRYPVLFLVSADGRACHKGGASPTSETQARAQLMLGRRFCGERRA